MRYRICGASRETGEDCTIELNAESPEAAILLANSHHILVSACEEISATPKKIKPVTPTEPNHPELHCPECGRLILLDHPETCPHCGFPMAEVPTQPSSLQTCQLTVIVAIGRGWTFNLASALNDTCSVEIDGQQMTGSARDGFSGQFELPPGEHILETVREGMTGEFRINLPEPGEYELRLGANQMSGTLFGKPKLPVKRIK